MTATRVTFQIEPLAVGGGLRLRGDLDLATAPELARELAGVDGSNGIMLEVSELTFIDSSGCSTILSYVRSAPDDAQVVLANPPPTIVRALELTGLLEHPQIEILPSDL